jgi:hypothetical protein
MMKLTKKLTAAFGTATAVLALSACAPAQDRPLSASEIFANAMTKPAGAEGPALWKVADHDTTIYMFGTIHALPDDVNWYDAEISAAVSSSDAVITEIKMDPASMADMQRLSLQKGTLPPETTLRSLLTEEQKTSYETALGKLGMPASAFDRFEPWMAGLTLTMLPLLQQGYSAEAGVDKVILSKAGQREQLALETAEFQIGIFDGMPQHAQIAFMVAAADGVDQVKGTLDSMVAEWIEGDAPALAAIMNEGMEDPTIAETLLYSRNRNWAEWIDARLDQPGTIFMAVGAGHLAGQNSVQDYLARRGIKSARLQ